MRTLRLCLVLALILSTFLASALPASTQTAGRRSAASSRREAAYRANNLGVALLEQFKYEEAAEAFAQALRLDRAFAIARLNRAIALYNLPDLPAAQREAQAAVRLLPETPQAHYLLGLIAKSQDRAAEALAAFRRVLAVDPQDPGVNVNIGQLLMAERRFSDAAAAFRQALAAEPYNLTAIYNLAMSLTRAGEREEGARLLEQFQTLREAGYGTTIGQNYLEQGRYAEAVASTGAEPNLVDAATPAVRFVDRTAEVFPALSSAARQASATPAPDASKLRTLSILKRHLSDSNWTPAAARQLVASLAGGVTLFDFDGDGDLDVFETGLTSAATRQRLLRNDNGRFTDVTAIAGLAANDDLATGAVAGDYDNDGKPDLFVLRYQRPTLYHNDGNGRFSDVTSAAKIPAYPFLSLTTAFLDFDHDGDLDIFIGGFADLTRPQASATTANGFTFPDHFAGAPNLLLRNNGNGTFLDITATAKVAGSAARRVVAVVPTDYDNRRDIDLLLLHYDDAPALLSNQRDGTFRDVAAEVGLPAAGRFTAVAAGDVNKDGFTDFFFGIDEDLTGDRTGDKAVDTDGRKRGGGQFAISDGKGKFITHSITAATGNTGGINDRINDGDSGGIRGGVSAAQFFDYDNDGLLDLVFAADGKLGVLRNLGKQPNGDPAGGRWVNVSERAVNIPGGASSTTVPAQRLRLAAGDLDGDGDTDLLAQTTSSNLASATSATGALRLVRNEGGNRQRALRVALVAKVSNRSGVGAKLEARSGSLKQKLETYAASPAPAPADLSFGLGRRAGVDAVRVLWPAGILQSETEIASRSTDRRAALALSLKITELDRKPSSCPYLYVWNGERFEFLTDFMGGGEMGYRLSSTRYNTPDPDEYVRIPGDRLKARNGRFELRVTNELEEVLYVDRLELLAVAHPADTEIFPNEGMSDPPRPFKLYATRHARPPASARDEHGCDVLSRLVAIDRAYPDDFELLKIRGYAQEHHLTLDLGAPVANPARADTRTLLLLTGWTDYAFSSDNLAAEQSGVAMLPPALQVKDADGNWRTVIANLGIPVGRPQTVTVDLTGKFLSASREVRIVTNMRIYWDQILVDTANAATPEAITRLETRAAVLGWRGFSAEVTPDGREPFGYDYGRVSPVSPWKVLQGRYTREGDVRELLARTDDCFVIARSGDEIALSFDAANLSPLPKGWKRTFLLYADGFSKEMDINSASPDAVTPLPFHAMTRYPYGADESYPKSPAHRDYLQRYNTRWVRAPVPGIEVVLVGGKGVGSRE